LELKFDAHTLPHSRLPANSTLRFAIWKSLLHDFDHITKLTTDHPE